MMLSFNSAALACHARRRITAYKLKPYTMASPSMSTESESSVVERATRPAMNSTRNIAALIQSTTRSTAR